MILKVLCNFGFASRLLSSLGAGFQSTSALYPFLSLFLMGLVSSSHLYPYLLNNLFAKIVAE